MFSTVFVQYKLSAEALAALPEDQRATLDRDARYQGWTADLQGSLLSAPLTLPQAPPGERLSVPLSVPWQGEALQTVQRLAAAQFLVVDMTAASHRGRELALLLSGKVADEGGDPLELFTPLPRPLLAAVEKTAAADLGAPRVMVMPSAYRPLPGGDVLLGVQAKLLYSSHRRQVNKVRELRADEHRLTGDASATVFETVNRAYFSDVLGEDTRRHKVMPLGSSQLRGPVLAALTGQPQPYGVLDGAAPAVPGAVTRQLLDAVLEGFNSPAAAAQHASREASRERQLQRERQRAEQAARAAREQEERLSEKRRREAQEQQEQQEQARREQERQEQERQERQRAEQDHRPPLPGEEGQPAAAGPQAVAPAEAGATPEPAPEPAPADPWQAIATQMAVNPLTLRAARAALAARRPLLLSGPPGIGKTRLATLLAEALAGPRAYTLVTADARWTSTDVVGGLGVVPGEGLNYRFQSGVVTRAAQRHAQRMAEDGRPWPLIIDEFNRAPQDEAFGRLLTVLDSDYRSLMPLVAREDGAAEDVYLPADFVLIVTMNDADVSRLHELGEALSRRFVTLQLDVPETERDLLRSRWAGREGELARLYRLVGTGDPAQDTAGQLRRQVPLGTAFLEDVRLLSDPAQAAALSLDEALAVLLPPALAPHLDRSSLEAAAQLAAQEAFPALRRALERQAARAAY